MVLGKEASSIQIIYLIFSQETTLKKFTDAVLSHSIFVHEVAPEDCCTKKAARAFGLLPIQVTKGFPPSAPHISRTQMRQYGSVLLLGQKSDGYVPFGKQ